MKRFFLTIAIILILFSQKVNAQSQVTFKPSEKNYEAVVTKILEDKQIEISAGVFQPYQKVEVQITNNNLEREKVIAELGGLVVTNNNLKTKLGDRVVLTHLKRVDGSDQFFVSDFVRKDSLFILGLAFFLAVVVIGKWRGLASFIGLYFSFLILIKFIIPQIIAGANPIVIAILGSFFIITVTLYLAHGFSKKTTAALLGTLISLFITALLALFFVNFLKLSGLGSEDASFLTMTPGIKINLQGILLAGIIIGALGVLDDITVSQSACVFELAEANKNLTWKELYKRGLNIGQDHIASLVNTLVLAYAGASLPLLLLFSISGGEPIATLVNREMIASEIVRTLVGSLGLVSAVPITTIIAARFALNK
ncbi:YibE/F family protein [Candidatus Roizmanbacteria bacterium]|nr:YibE/F family protein [Candidatus Roizmanbacteria bacterium]